MTEVRCCIMSQFVELPNALNHLFVLNNQRTIKQQQENRVFISPLPKHHHLFTHSMNDKTNKRNKMCGAASSAQNFSAPVSGCGKSPIIAFGCLHNSPSAPHHQIKHFKRLTRMCFEAAGITAVLEVFHWSFKAFSKDFLKFEAFETAYEK